MRFSDVMKPARSWDEAAMQRANASTISGGAALNMVRGCRRENIETMEEVLLLDTQKTACEAMNAEQRAASQQTRAALYHVIRHSF